MQSEQFSVGLGGDGGAAVPQVSPIVVVVSCRSQFMPYSRWCLCLARVLKV